MSRPRWRRRLLLAGVVGGLLAAPGASPDTGRSGGLTPAEQKALQIVSVQAVGEEPTGLVVTATFAGDIQDALGRGNLRHAAVAMVLVPKTAPLVSAGLVTQGAGAVGQTLRRTHSTEIGVLRDRRALVFFIHGPGASQVGEVVVKAFARSPVTGSRTAQAALDGSPVVISQTKWARWEETIATDQMKVNFTAQGLGSAGCEELAKLKTSMEKIIRRAEARARTLKRYETRIAAAIEAAKSKAATPPAATLNDVSGFVGFEEAAPARGDASSEVSWLESMQAALAQTQARNDFLLLTARSTLRAVEAAIAACSPGTAPPPPPSGYGLALDAGYDHTTPGPPGYPSTVCGDFSTDPPLDGGTWEAELTWAGGSKKASGQLAGGNGRVVFGIPSAQTYHLKVTVDDGKGNKQVAEAVIPVPLPDPAHPELNKTKSCAAPPPPA